MPLTPDQRELLRKRLRANVSFRKTVRTSGVSNAQEVLQRYNQEQREDEKKLMQDMIQEMKGMKRTHSKKFVNSVTNTMTDSQLQTLRQQAGPDIQHLIPTKGDAMEITTSHKTLPRRGAASGPFAASDFSAVEFLSSCA